MSPFLYRCPATGLNVQGFIAEDVDDSETFVAVTYHACSRVHLVDLKTGRVLGAEEEA